MRLAKMLMNGKRETAPLSEEITGLNGVRPTKGSPGGSAWGLESTAGDSSCSVTGIVSRKDPDV
jgi:hypothetical protein